MVVVERMALLLAPLLLLEEQDAERGGEEVAGEGAEGEAMAPRRERARLHPLPLLLPRSE